MRDVHCELLKQIIFTWKLTFAPEPEEIESALLGMNPSTLDEVPKAVSSFSRVTIARFSDPPILKDSCRK